jgi:probable HAF family extracellular repeat protein
MRILLSSAALLAASLSVPAAAAPHYAITELAPLAGDNVSYAFGVNSSGQVAGASSAGSGYANIGVRWNSDGTAQPVGAGNSINYAINDAGATAGFDFVWDDYAYKGVIAAPGGDKTYVVAGLGTFLTAISGNGNAAGYAGNSIEDDQAVLYSGGSAQVLGVLGGATSQAWGVNDAGQVVGYSTWQDGNSDLHAFLYQSGTMSDLGTLGGSSSYAYGINNAGAVVGEAFTAGDAASHAYIFRDGAMVDLGTLAADGTGVSSWANAINDSGVIVGASQTSADSAYYATLWQGGRSYDLNALIQPGLGWTLDSAWSISSNGYIVGLGTLNGQQRGFLLSLLPSVPEPASWAMMLVGFGAVGAAMRRRGRPAFA